MCCAPPTPSTADPPAAKGRVEEKDKAKKKKKKMPAHNLPSEGWKDKVINPESVREVGLERSLPSLANAKKPF
jgi:hypothetical protein